MKKTILILSVLFFLGCKKESMYSGTYNRVGTVNESGFTADTIQEYITFINSCNIVSTKGVGIYTADKIYINNNVYALRIGSRVIYLDSVMYFKN